MASTLQMKEYFYSTQEFIPETHYLLSHLAHSQSVDLRTLFWRPWRRFLPICLLTQLWGRRSGHPLLPRKTLACQVNQPSPGRPRG